MRSFKKLAAAVKWCLASISVLAVCAGGIALAESGSSTVQVMICPSEGESTLTITSPASDSVVGDSRMTISGAVQYISQLDIYIDEAYDTTTALEYDDTSYEEMLTLEPGTHTVKVVAFDSCHQTTHTQNIVVTYEPTVITNGPQGEGGDQSADSSSSSRQNATGDGVEQIAPVQTQSLPQRAIVTLRAIADDIGLSTKGTPLSFVDILDSFLVLLIIAMMLFPRRFARWGIVVYSAFRRKFFGGVPVAIKKRKKRFTLPPHAIRWTRLSAFVLLVFVFL